MKLALTAAMGAILMAGGAVAQPLATYALPAEVRYPEGVALDPATGALYTAGAEDGLLVRLDPTTGRSTVVAPAGTVIPAGSTAFPGALGMKLDPAGRLWMALGRTGNMAVVDSRTGALLKRFETKREGGLINDAAVTTSAVYFTDTLNPVLWRVPVSGGTIGELEPWLDFTGTALQWGPGANINGIAPTPDGKTLIVVQMAKGLLFTIDTATRKVAPIDLKGELVEGADGLVLDGSTLYVVRQPAAEIVTVRLSPDLASGTVVSRFKDPALLWPATAAKAGDHLVVVNAQFNKRTTNDPTTPFTLVRVPLSRLQGK
jgi:Cu-Zn family superoxide dismutase